MAAGDAEVPLLRRLLEAAGYRLEDRPAGLRAVRPRDGRAILLVAGRQSPVELEAEFPPDALHRILVYGENPGDVARRLASDRGLEILDPASLGPALGELLLLPTGPSEVPAGAASAPVEAPPGLFPEGERVVDPRLGRAEAEALAGVEGFRFTLRLIPFFVAPYRVRVASAHGGAGATSDHLVAVNALSGRTEIWEVGDRSLVADLEGAPQRLDPLLTAEEATTRAERALQRRHTVWVDHTEQHGGALVIERRRVPPGTGDLRIGTPTLVHAPYWYVEGAQGRVVLDAVTGARAPADTHDPESLVP